MSEPNVGCYTQKRTPAKMRIAGKLVAGLTARVRRLRFAPVGKRNQAYEISGAHNIGGSAVRLGGPDVF